MSSAHIMIYAGELAALGTAITWSISISIFTLASMRIGSFSMSHFRLFFAILLLIILNKIMTGSFLPLGLTLNAWVFAGLSGLTGFFLCDALLFQGCVDAGPRIGILIFNLSPFFGAFLANLFLNESLKHGAWLGIIITMSGVMWVVSLEKKDNNKPKIHLKRGILLATCAGLFQAISFVLAKPIMSGHDTVNPVTVTLIRALFGLAAFWGISLVRGRLVKVIKKAKDTKAILYIAMGAVVGPSFGVWLSMVAVKHAPIGIAMTIMALMPVTILPIAAIVYKEKITFKIFLGALIACVGVGVLFNV